jgi:hypothetical protein
MAESPTGLSPKVDRRTALSAEREVNGKTPLCPSAVSPFQNAVRYSNFTSMPDISGSHGLSTSIPSFSVLFGSTLVLSYQGHRPIKLVTNL